MSSRSIRRLAGLGAVLALGVAAVPALAHAPVRGTSPANGSTVNPVRAVSVRFADAITTGTITVARSNGSPVATTAAGPDPRSHSRLRATFARRLRAGRYVVSWRALATDGHRQRGTFRFRVL